QVPSALEPLRNHDGEKLDAEHRPQDTVEAPVTVSSGSKTSIGVGLKRLDLPVPRDFSTNGFPETEIVPEAWSKPDLDALPETIRGLRVVGNFRSNPLMSSLERKFPTIRGLRVVGNFLSSEDIKGLERFRRVETLQFRPGNLDREHIPCKVTDRAVQLLGIFPDLKHLEIREAALLTD